jgi:hypothetical protein
VQCGDSITVTARCIDIHDCVIEGSFAITCGEIVACPDAQLTAVVGDECVQGRRKVTFTVTLEGVTQDTSITGSIKTGDTSVVNEIELPVEYSAATGVRHGKQGVCSLLSGGQLHQYPIGACRGMRGRDAAHECCRKYRRASAHRCV